MRVQTILIAIPVCLFLLATLLILYQKSPADNNYSQRITVLRDDLSSDIEFVRSEVKDLKGIKITAYQV